MEKGETTLCVILSGWRQRHRPFLCPATWGNGTGTRHSLILSCHQDKDVLEAGKMAQGVRAFGALAKDQSSVPNTHVRWLPIACLLLVSVGTSTHIHIPPQRHLTKDKVNL